MLYLPFTGALRIIGHGFGNWYITNIWSFLNLKESGQLSNVTFTEVLVSSCCSAGKPIEEKIEQYGPYVMNSQTELLEAMRDYQMGKMGILIEEDL